MRLLAHAKLNVSLSVGPSRSDGYHGVDTLVQFITLADTVELVPAPHGVRVSGNIGIPEEEDLCYRAAVAALAAKRRPAGVMIAIEKRIPIGAGLGGGSSDAAAVLRAVDWMYPPALPAAELQRLASGLGADVPLFLEEGRLRAVGRGDRIVERRASPRECYVVVVPPFRCTTAEIYAHYRAVAEAAPAPLGANDLLDAALAVHPELARYHAAVCGLGAAFAGMTGSGSSCFAAFADPAEAERAARLLEQEVPDASLLRADACPVGARWLDHAIEGRPTCTSP